MLPETNLSFRQHFRGWRTGSGLEIGCDFSVGGLLVLSLLATPLPALNTTRLYWSSPRLSVSEGPLATLIIIVFSFLPVFQFCHSTPIHLGSYRPLCSQGSQFYISIFYSISPDCRGQSHWDSQGRGCPSHQLIPYGFGKWSVLWVPLWNTVNWWIFQSYRVYPP